ncbi:MAG: PriCT-2 domain-containing protein [Planctomycetes bacterium]|nr:PriCT-2 domain-containing protein [Planctomycetota bacterium]
MGPLSQASDKYAPGECAKQWRRSFKAKSNGVTIASLIQWAR